MHKIIIESLIITFLASLILCAQITKEQIAVLNLEAVGVSETESMTLTDRLRSEIIRTDAFILLERSKMSEILQEQGFQMTGCTSTECAVEAGRLLNVRQICAGSVGKVGALYTITIRLIDVETGAVAKIVTEDYQGPVEQLLTISIRNVAFKLAGKIPPDILTDDPGKATGDIFIKSDPSDAEIFLDGFNTGRRTPATLRGVTIGSHEIMVIKEGLISSKVVNVKSNDVVYEDLQLASGSGPLRIYSDPPEVEVYIDKKLIGKTPVILRDIKVGEHLLWFKKLGYNSVEKKVEIIPMQSTIVEAKLYRHTQILISSKPQGALVYLNGQLKGTTRIIIPVNPNEDIHVKLSMKDYADWEETINLKEGSNENVNATMSRLTGTLKLKGYPAGSMLSINKNSYILSKDEVNLPVGEYSIKVHRPGYNKKEFNVKIEAGKTREVGAELPPKTTAAAITRSFFVPGWGQTYQDKRTRSMLYAVAFIGSAGGSYYYTYTYNKAIEDYNNMREQYLAAFDQTTINTLRQQMDKAYNDIKPNEDIRNIFYAAAGAIWFINVVDALFLPPRWERGVRLSAASNDGNFVAGVEIKF